MKTKVFKLIVVSLWASVCRAEGALAVPQDLGGVKSMYTMKIGELLTHSLADLAANERPAVKNAIDLRCWGTPSHDLYIGLEQHLQIKAPLKTVAAVLDDMSQYQDLFPGFKNIHELSRE